MTDSIDLDEIETGDDSEEGSEPEPNRGDWFWRGEGDPEAETEVTTGTEAETGRTSASKSASGSSSAGDDVDVEGSAAVPHVPHQNKDKPVGMPTNQGGAGGTSARAAAEAEAEANAHADSDSAHQEASGPHGGGVDDLTMAFTYRAAKRLADPAFVFAGAAWADWIGIVGDVDAHVINKFQRENGIDADFFNGSGTGPSERLGEITEMSMFFADRMVVVGCEDEEWIAEESGWEFVPFETAAEKAGWDFD